MIKAITFDIWDTILVDDSDEKYRKKNGLPLKSIERKSEIINLIISENIHISIEELEKKYGPGPLPYILTPISWLHFHWF